jgi:hypothetical protein
MLRLVAFVRIDVSEERYSEMSVLTTAIRRKIPDDGILQSRCHENLKSYIIKFSRLYKIHFKLYSTT